MPRRSAAPWPTTTASSPLGRRVGDAGERGGHPVGDDDGRLAVRRVPGGALGRVALADLLVGQALPVAAEALAQVLVQGDRQAGELGQRRRRSADARIRSEEKIASGRRAASGRRPARPAPRRSRRAGCPSAPGTGARRSRSSGRAATARAACAALSVRLRSSPGYHRVADQGRLGQRDDRAVLPDALEGVEGALLLVLDVDHDVVVVEQHPAALVLALAADQGGACLLELELYLVDDRADLPVVGAGAQQERVGDRELVADVVGDDVSGQLLCRGERGDLGELNGSRGGSHVAGSASLVEMFTAFSFSCLRKRSSMLEAPC